VGASRLLTYSDRWFGGRRDAMARMATLYDNYNRYKLGIPLPQAYPYPNYNWA
jgi:hypothetical protein